MRSKWFFVFGFIALIGLLYYSILEENRIWDKQIEKERLFNQVIEASYSNKPIAVVKENINVKHPEVLFRNWVETHPNYKKEVALGKLEISFSNGSYILHAFTSEGEQYDVRLIRKGNVLYKER